MARFAIKWGVPEMETLWNDLTGKADAGTLDRDELRLFKKLVKTATLLAENPAHPGLSSHEISSLTERYGMKVWQSYLENRTPAAGRIYWIYGPTRGSITIIGVEAHPESGKSRGYQKVSLSRPRASDPELPRGRTTR
jgi:hypothetical protein